MSWQPANDPKPGDRLSCDAIETVIVPRSRDLGSFEVRRALPSAQRQMVGPFIFFDQMGPAEFLLGAGMDVRPHPHIGLSTGHNEEGWNGGRYGVYHDLDTWRSYVSAAGFVEINHYYRPTGLSRERQPWLASSRRVFWKSDSKRLEACKALGEETIDGYLVQAQKH
jgi:hypothetical protein